MCFPLSILTCDPPTIEQTKRLFWATLESFSAAERTLFLRFVWARDRLNAHTNARVRFQVRVTFH